MAEWIQLWLLCHALVQGSPVRTGFPDGACLEQQDGLLVNVFRVIEDAYHKVMQERIKDASQ